VSKAYLRKIGYDIGIISEYSGMNKDYVLLEEDEDATHFINFLKNKGISHSLQERYVRTVKYTHCFNLKFFDCKFKEGDEIKLRGVCGEPVWFDISKFMGGYVHCWRHNRLYRINLKHIYTLGVEYKFAR
tara:strand:- start:90 stop:479 length:390 start_codon:yes stop_codon:yes gene_type:complete